MTLRRRSYLAEGRYYKLHRKISIDEVARRWREGGEKAYDESMPVMYSLREVWPHREYTWTRAKSRRSSGEWDALLADMKTNGWRKSDPLVLNVGRQGGVKVGEGNHRLAIAKELGIRVIPVSVLFYTGKVTKDSLRREVPKKRVKPQKVAPDVSSGAREPGDDDGSIDDIMKNLGF